MTFKNLASQTNTRALQRNTPVTQVIPGRQADMVQVGGGFLFKLDNWARLDRFLIMGTENGTYRTGENKLTAENLIVIKGLLTEDGIRVVDRTIEISSSGRAKNNDYALLVMAYAISEGTPEVKRYAGRNLHLVARIGTHILHFTQFANGMRGWGKVLKSTVANWYGAKSADQIAYDAIKYQSRDGWSQRDILRLAHPKAGDDALKNSTYKYIVKGRAGMKEGEQVPAVIVAFEQAKTADEKTLVQLIGTHRLSHEMIPNERKGSPAVWEAMLAHMGTSALIRNINKMTSVGLLTAYSDATKFVVAQLNNLDKLRKDKIHPMQLLIARKQYALGRGDKGNLTWIPIAAITQALENAFYLSFATIEPSGLNMMLAIDVSRSMNSACHGAAMITAHEAAAVMAMATLRVEKWSAIYGFDHKFRELGILATDNLDTVMKKTFSPNFGSTNCSLPMQVAEANKWKIDCFAVYTDNETNQGANHPVQALQNYRNRMGVPHSKLVTCGMTVTGFTIADPKDAGMLDVVGFDANAPAIISAFSAGQL
jgi:60 kDa SS-A/Ro ribonucleoprotein